MTNQSGLPLGATQHTNTFEVAIGEIRIMNVLETLSHAVQLCHGIRCVDAWEGRTLPVPTCWRTYFRYTA